MRILLSLLFAVIGAVLAVGGVRLAMLGGALLADGIRSLRP